jgi:hypothetical protein
MIISTDSPIAIFSMLTSHLLVIEITVVSFTAIWELIAV